MEDLTFSEWSDFLGGNRWLSVYGLRQSSDEDDDEVDGDGDYDGFASGESTSATLAFPAPALFRCRTSSSACSGRPCNV